MKSSGVAILIMSLAATVPAAPQKVSPAQIPVILDTDIGTDIDDAFALALALASPEIDLRGVTTVSADAFTRALIACRFLDAVGHPEIPVAPGRPRRAAPAIEGQYQYGLRPARKRSVQKPAVEFLYDQLKANPGAITLVSVGDLTNVAELITRHPDSKAWIKRIVLMGGSVRVGYNAKPPPVREWNIRSDVKAAQIVFQSGVPLVVAPVDATTTVRLTEPYRRRIFETDKPLCWHLHALYELWGKETPVLFDPVAVALAFDESFCMMEDLRIEVDDEGYTREVAGKPNCRVATSIRADDFLRWYVGRVTAQRAAVGMSAPGSHASSPREPTNVSRAVPQGDMPRRVHVVEDYETDIERRWWLAGRLVAEKDSAGGSRACRAVLCRDFDGKMGNQDAIYRAVIFNPVPGPPMGSHTRLSFRYRLHGTDRLRVQIYSLTNGYHRHLTLTGLPQDRWASATVDMTDARRPDGSGGPLSEDERIDDIQFYIDPKADLMIDDIVLYDAALPGERRPFPRRILFTGWFDTGKQGQEWPGDFEIVPHEKPFTWKAAKSAVNPETGKPWIRAHLRGRRPVRGPMELRFRYRLTGGNTLRVALVNTETKQTLEAAPNKTTSGDWEETIVGFPVPRAAGTEFRAVDEIHFLIEKGAQLLVDDVLLYEPGEVTHDER